MTYRPTYTTIPYSTLEMQLNAALHTCTVSSNTVHYSMVDCTCMYSICHYKPFTKCLK